MAVRPSRLLLLSSRARVTVRELLPMLPLSLRSSRSLLPPNRRRDHPPSVRTLHPIAPHHAPRRAPLRPPKLPRRQSIRQLPRVRLVLLLVRVRVLVLNRRRERPDRRRG